MKQVSFHITILEIFAALVVTITFAVTYTFYTAYKESVYSLSNQVVLSTTEKVKN